MTKAEFINAVSEKVKQPKKLVGDVVDAVFEGIADVLKKKDKITFVGFGTFSVVKRKARKGVNPKTGKPIKIPAKMAPKFSAGKALKDAVK